jgi:hypothetical protein
VDPALVNASWLIALMIAISIAFAAHSWHRSPSGGWVSIMVLGQLVGLIFTLLLNHIRKP